MFQHTAARRRLDSKTILCRLFEGFQHTAARRRLEVLEPFGAEVEKFQHTAARRRLDTVNKALQQKLAVSTHSRPKAAGPSANCRTAEHSGFNTQPPEGGWLNPYLSPKHTSCFNTQPPEGGWNDDTTSGDVNVVSTHSRPKAAGRSVDGVLRQASVSTHSRPKAAGLVVIMNSIVIICFNTQPPEGGWFKNGWF